MKSTEIKLLTLHMFLGAVTVTGTGVIYAQSLFWSLESCMEESYKKKHICEWIILNIDCLTDKRAALEWVVRSYFIFMGDTSLVQRLEKKTWGQNSKVTR